MYYTISAIRLHLRIHNAKDTSSNEELSEKYCIRKIDSLKLKR